MPSNFNHSSQDERYMPPTISSPNRRMKLLAKVAGAHEERVRRVQMISDQPGLANVPRSPNGIAVNTLNNLLPADVLSDIFSLVLKDPCGFEAFPVTRLPFRVKGNTVEEAQHWRTLLLVCRTWTFVMESSPILWRDVIIGDRHPEAHLQYFLKRAATTMSLRVYLVGVGGLPAVANIVHRLQVLKLFIRPGGYPKTLEVLDRPAPLLECLEICTLSSARVGSDFPSLLEQDVGLLPELFDGTTPRLRRMRLEQFSALPAWPIRNLTHLYLSGWRTGLTADDAFGNFIEFLQACPDLEDLTLRNTAWWIPRLQSLTRKFEKVSLSKLKRLIVINPYPPECGHLLRHFDLPTGVVLIIDEVINCGATNTKIVFPPDWADSPFVCGISSVEFYQDDGSNATIIALGSAGSFVVSLRRGDEEDETEFRPDLFREWVAFLSRAQIKELWVVGPPNFDEDFDEDYPFSWEWLPHLTKLCIHNRNTSRFAVSLGVNPFILERLDTVWVSDKHFDGQDLEAWFFLLKCGYPIRHFRFTTCQDVPWSPTSIGPTIEKDLPTIEWNKPFPRMPIPKDFEDLFCARLYNEKSCTLLVDDIWAAIRSNKAVTQLSFSEASRIVKHRFPDFVSPQSPNLLPADRDSLHS